MLYYKRNQVVHLAKHSSISPFDANIDEVILMVLVRWNVYPTDLNKNLYNFFSKNFFLNKLFMIAILKNDKIFEGKIP